MFKNLSGSLKLQQRHKKLYLSFMELTKFKLSALNTVGAYTTFYYHAPLAGVGLIESAVFIASTQAIAMSTQCFGQVREAEMDSKMARTQNRPMVK